MNFTHLSRRLSSRLFTIREVCTSKRICAPPKKSAGMVSAGARPGIEVETDAAVLTKYCCGANIHKEGSDPQLKPDNEYPDWLWALDLEPNTRTIEDLNKDSFKYWKKIKKNHIKRQNIADKLKFQ